MKGTLLVGDHALNGLIVIHWCSQCVPVCFEPMSTQHQVHAIPLIRAIPQHQGGDPGKPQSYDMAWSATQPGHRMTQDEHWMMA